MAKPLRPDVGLLMTAEMVRAYAAGRKTETRRLPKTQPAPGAVFTGFDGAGRAQFDDGTAWPARYGIVGDRCWFRETWATVASLDHLPPRSLWQYERPPALYYASWPDESAARRSVNRGKWRSGMLMPRWAAQYAPLITGRSVERLGDISEAAAQAEGVTLPARTVTLYHGIFADAYAALWERIHGAGNWARNRGQWVQVIQFAPHTGAP